MKIIVFFFFIDYPRNGRLYQQGYRSMIVVWDRVPNFNATGDSDGEFYEVRFELNNPPIFFPQTMTIEIAYEEPEIKFSNLLINTQVRMRVGLKYNTRKPVKLFSPYEVFQTKSVPTELELGEYEMQASFFSTYRRHNGDKTK